jgi:addiction module RelE/StbE family toxin
MKVRYQKSFTEQFTKLSKDQKLLVKEAIELFIEDPMHGSLRNHPLRGIWASYRSISADVDLRLHYRVVSEDVVLFVAVGTHDQLYK